MTSYEKIEEWNFIKLTTFSHIKVSNMLHKHLQIKKLSAHQVLHLRTWSKMQSCENLKALLEAVYAWFHWISASIQNCWNMEACIHRKKRAIKTKVQRWIGSKEDSSAGYGNYLLSTFKGRNHESVSSFNEF